MRTNSLACAISSAAHSSSSVADSSRQVRLLRIVPLASGTIRSNLTWRDESATDEELWAALDMAQASEFVRNKPQGLDAPVEAGG